MRTRYNAKAIDELNEFERYIKTKEEIQEIINRK